MNGKMSGIKENLKNNECDENPEAEEITGASGG